MQQSKNDVDAFELATDGDAVRDWSQRFRRFGIITLTDLIPADIRAQVRREAESLLDGFGERRDLRLATTGYTRRSMTVVPSERIAEHGGIIPSFYRSPALTQALESITGEALHPCPKTDEEFLISRHEKAGDTHGWHWGDYSFALIWVLVAPEIEAGGLLQCVPHTNWDKTAPGIMRYLRDNPINTYHFESGDVYFLRTDTTLHRTIPLVKDTTRIMLNMTWGSSGDLDRTLTGDDRWWENADVSTAAPAALQS